jgi:hypothetical protein
LRDITRLLNGKLQVILSTEHPLLSLLRVAVNSFVLVDPSRRHAASSSQLPPVSPVHSSHLAPCLPPVRHHCSCDLLTNDRHTQSSKAVVSKVLGNFEVRPSLAFILKSSPSFSVYRHHGLFLSIHPGQPCFPYNFNPENVSIVSSRSLYERDFSSHSAGGTSPAFRHSAVLRRLLHGTTLLPPHYLLALSSEPEVPIRARTHNEEYYHG